MRQLPSLSRRTLVAAAALAAFVPGTAARKQRKPKPKPPQAFVAMTVTGVVHRPAGEEPGFTWRIDGALYHPGSGIGDDFPGEVDVPTAFTGAQTREKIVREAQEGAAFALGFSGIVVPPERVAVVLL